MMKLLILLLSTLINLSLSKVQRVSKAKKNTLKVSKKLLNHA